MLIIIGVVVFVLLFVKWFIGKKLESHIFELNEEKLDKQKEAFDSGMQRIKFLSGKSSLYGQWTENSKNSTSVFIVHGNGETLSDWVDTQNLLHTMGYNSFVFDFSGFGSSTGKATINNLHKNTIDAWSKFCEISSPKQKRIIVSHSLGVAVLLHSISVFKSKPSRIILHGSFSSVRNIAVFMGSIPFYLKWIIPNVYNNIKNIKRIDSVPTSIFHSKNDQKIPFLMSEEIASVTAKTKLTLLEDFGHNAVYENPQKEFWQKLLI